MVFIEYNFLNYLIRNDIYSHYQVILQIGFLISPFYLIFYEAVNWRKSIANKPNDNFPFYLETKQSGNTIFERRRKAKFYSGIFHDLCKLSSYDVLQIKI